MHEELYGIVRDAIAGYGVQEVAVAIDKAHRGQIDGRIVTTDNMHLFRRYRNTVSANAAQLMREAKGVRNG